MFSYIKKVRVKGFFFLTLTLQEKGCHQVKNSIKSIYIHIYTISFYLIKSSYTERKQVSCFLIFFETVLLSNTKSSSVTVTHLFVWNIRANSVTHTLQRCDCYTRDSFAWMFESCIMASLITKLNFWTKKMVFYELWLAQRNLLAISDYSWVRYIQCFKMWREFFIRIKLLKFHEDYAILEVHFLYI